MMRMRKVTDVKVFISHRESVCGECGQNLGHHAWITLDREKGAVCLSCADMEHLVFLPAGDAALTRRAFQESTLAAVVLKWSTRRERYERQGILVEEQALRRAEEASLLDEQIRERRREREAERRKEYDRAYVARFAERIRQLFPLCPPGREDLIAEHACLKYSGRIGRTASAKDLDVKAVILAVKAHVRHIETPYDKLLAKGVDRHEARRRVEGRVDEFLRMWSSE
jgi:hypothetical protein